MGLGWKSQLPSEQSGFAAGSVESGGKSFPGCFYVDLSKLITVFDMAPVIAGAGPASPWLLSSSDLVQQAQAHFTCNLGFEEMVA